MDTTSSEFFEEKYRGSVDPWQFAASEYELGRYEAILRALRPRRYRRAFEPGCSIGVLTEGLAGLCEQVEAVDLSETAVRRAQERCSAWPQVQVRTGTLPDALPAGVFDLVVLSEIGYYFDEAALERVATLLVSRLEPGGVLLAAHWLGFSEDHILSGDRVHEVLGTVPGLALDHAARMTGFRLDRWTRVRGEGR